MTLIKIPNPNDNGVKMRLSIETKEDTFHIESTIYYETETGELKFIIENKAKILETIELLKAAEPIEQLILDYLD